MRIIILAILLLVSIQSKYLDSKSCKECHEDIYYEHINSMHHKSSLFKDIFHSSIKKLTTPNKYDCALCHTPGAINLRAIMEGSEKPSQTDKRQNDGVSCFYCHQITKVLETKHRNINFYNYKENTKPNFFGNIDDYADSDKHKSGSNEIYKNSKVCMGCHGKKYNKYNIQICNGYDEYNKTSNCINCHMPKYPGGITKINKKGREQYTSHEFLGIKDEQMVKKAVKLMLKKIDNTHIQLIIQNKMGHNIIMQPMRLKYVKTSITRDGKIIWQNFKDDPLEDKEATFTRLFEDNNKKQVLPPFAKNIKFDNNIKANSFKTIVYKVPQLKKGDIIKAQWISFVVRPSLAKKLKLTNKEFTKKYLGSDIEIVCN
jgi:hypothetical protein